MPYKKTPKLRHRGRERFLYVGKGFLRKRKAKIEEQRLLFHENVFCNMQLRHRTVLALSGALLQKAVPFSTMTVF